MRLVITLLATFLLGSGIGCTNGPCDQFRSGPVEVST